MMTDSTYLIDTSCLIQAHQVYYPFDIAPSFWEFMNINFINGNFILTNKVADEISRGKDDLSNWMTSSLSKFEELNCHEDADIMTYYGEIMTWGQSHPQYTQLAKNVFANFEHADPFLVASSLAKKAVVVSQEKSAPGSKNNIKLPDICDKFHTPHIDTFTLLRRFQFTM